MSVDYHKHCQKTVLPVYGNEKGEGATWNILYSYRNNLPNLTKNWIEYFHNTQNITEDILSILRIINDSVSGEIKEWVHLSFISQETGYES